VTVAVPHNKKASAVDDGATFDSTTPSSKKHSKKKHKKHSKKKHKKHSKKKHKKHSKKKHKKHHDSDSDSDSN